MTDQEQYANYQQVEGHSYNIDVPPSGSKRRRFGEPAKFLPVAFCLCTILILYTIYTGFHCVPMLQFDVQDEHRDDELRRRGIVHLAVFNVITLMVIWCYFRALLTNPGEVPDGDPQWDYTPHDSNPRSAFDGVNVTLKETKRTGDRRHCKWCGKYKPDRCHHCRVCRSCILKMDHHCPWIYNCVGHGNYKYFFLLLMYSVTCLHMIVWTMGFSLQRAIVLDTPIMPMFFLMFGETIALFLAVLLTSFWFFHIWLLLKAMTTIEFCEKSMPKPAKPGEPEASVNFRSIYDQGLANNMATVLGSNPLLMFLPIYPSPGDGLDFTNDKSPLISQANYYERRPKQRNNGGSYAAYGEPDESLGGHYHGYSA